MYQRLGLVSCLFLARCARACVPNTRLEAANLISNSSGDRLYVSLSFVGMRTDRAHERWSLSIRSMTTACREIARRNVGPVGISDDGEFHFEAPLPPHSAESLVLSACRACSGCSAPAAPFAKSAACFGTGVCVHESFRQPVLQPGAARPSGRKACDDALNSGDGYWLIDDATHREIEWRVSDACTLPSHATLAAQLRSKAGLSLLFVGDSLLEEQAMLFARTVGYDMTELKRHCVGGSSHFRDFDAVSDMRPDVRMRWSGAPLCAGNGDPMPVDDVAWRRNIETAANASRFPLTHDARSLNWSQTAAQVVVVAGIPVFHSFDESIKQVSPDVDNATGHRALAYVRFLLSLYPDLLIVLVGQGAVQTRAAEQERFCNADVRRATRTVKAHLRRVRWASNRWQRIPVFIDLSPIYYSQLELFSAVEPRRFPALVKKRSVLYNMHCSALGRWNQRDHINGILPACTEASRILKYATLRNINNETLLATPPPERRAPTRRRLR